MKGYSRFRYRRRDTLANHLKRSSMNSALHDMEIAERVAGILRPIFDKLNVGSPISGAQCRIAHEKERPVRKSDAQDDYDPFETRDCLVITVYLRSVASLSRFTQVKPTLTDALAIHGFGCYKLVGVCAPRAYVTIGNDSGSREPISRGPSAKACERARKLADSLPEDSDLRASLLRLASALKP